MKSAIFSLNLCAITLTYFSTLTLWVLKLSNPLVPASVALLAVTLGFFFQQFLRLRFEKILPNPRLSFLINLFLLTSFYSIDKALSPFGLPLSAGTTLALLFIQGFLFFPPPGDEQRLPLCSLVCALLLFTFHWQGNHKGSLLASFFLLMSYIFFSSFAEKSYPPLQRFRFFWPLLPWIFLITFQLQMIDQASKPLFESENLEHSFRYIEDHSKGTLPIHRLEVNSYEKFNSETEQQRYLCLVGLPFQIQKTLEGVPKSVLILGGADGFAARNVLGFGSVKKVTVVDAKGALQKLAREELKFRMYNLDSFKSPKVEYIQKDIFNFVHNPEERKYDAVLIDLPPPQNLITFRIFTQEFLEELSRHVEEKSIVAIASPPFDPGKEWSSLTYETQSGRDAFVLLTLKREERVLETLFNTLSKGPGRLPCKRKGHEEPNLPYLTLSTLFKGL